MDDLDLLVNPAFYILNFNVKRGTQEDLTLIQHPSKLREPLIKFTKLNLSLGIEMREFFLSKGANVF